MAPLGCDRCGMEKPLVANEQGQALCDVCQLAIEHEFDITEKVKNSPLLARLVEEVRLEQVDDRPVGYNRMHNRHNRSGPYRRPSPPPAPDPEPPKPEPEPKKD